VAISLRRKRKWGGKLNEKMKGTGYRIGMEKEGEGYP